LPVVEKEHLPFAPTGPWPVGGITPLELWQWKQPDVSGHFKMHHLWSLQSAPPLTGVFLGFLGSFWQGVFLFP
jgi:hypothetical protein